MLLNNKKTKIVCTIGPASQKEEVLSKLIKSGMNVARINFSHGEYSDHQEKIDSVRRLSKKFNVPIAVLQDLCGPKIRIGDLKDGKIVLKEGQTFILTTKHIIGDSEKVFVNFASLHNEVKPGQEISIDDGKKHLQVVEVKGNDIVCKVLAGGELTGRKGVNVPGANLSISSLTEKDKKDIEFGILNKVDFVALSFVRKPEDIEDLRKILRNSGSDSAIIAKIETAEAVSNLDKIIEVSDGVMVARGDLAIETPAENVPLLQKEIIKKCNALGKPVITATQMLESMIESPVPTRAEVSDVANAILDGTDAVMLSAESAMGKYPVEAVKVMTRVALNMEKNHMKGPNLKQGEKYPDFYDGVADSISDEIVDLAQSVKAKFIVALTNSGFTARLISRYKPAQLILALTPDERTMNKLTLSFGCHPVLINKFERFVHAMEIIRDFSLENKIAKKGDLVTVAAGLPFGEFLGTNTILVEKI